MNTLPLPLIRCASIVLFVAYSAGPCPGQVLKCRKLEDGISCDLPGSTLRLQVCSPRIIRVLCSPAGGGRAHPSVSVINAHPGDTHFTFAENSSVVALGTAALRATVEKSTGALALYDSAGTNLLREPPRARTISPAALPGDSAWTVRQDFLSPDDEAIYGLGQYQDGIINWKNAYLRLKQRNTVIAMPVIVSNKGYGLFWDNYSYTEFNPDLTRLDLRQAGNSLQGTLKASENGRYVFVIERENVKSIEFKVGGKSVYAHADGVYNSVALAEADLAADSSYPLELADRDRITLPPVGAAWLVPEGGKPGERGLRGEYFANRNFEGKPALVRTDTVVDFDWGDGGPGGGFPRENFTVRWSGKLIAPATKDSCTLALTTDDGVRLYVDGKLVMNDWVERSPVTDEYRMSIDSGKSYDIRIEYFQSGGGASARFGWDLAPSAGGDRDLLKNVSISFRRPSQGKEMALQSRVADAIDYYFIYGPDADAIVGGMRSLTGRAPLYPKWAYGFFLSHFLWGTQDKMLEVARGHRERKIPVDCIVQDGLFWKVWPENEWGSQRFDPARYPDPGAMIRTLHGLGFHLMISAWPRFNSNTDTYRMMAEKGFMLGLQRTRAEGKEGVSIEDVTTNAAYDPFSEGARKLYWQFLNERLFSLGVDAWWLDATEPEWGYDFSRARTAMGSGERYLNCYALMSTKGVYEGQRGTSDSKRPFILTRSSFPGEQHYAATAWSGDIGYDWGVYRNQITAGLNFCITGVPYWTNDIGGFVPGADLSSADYLELLTRWYQFGVFCPIFRVHGCRNTELWAGGEESERQLVRAVNLRYRLLPYIYSLGAMVTFRNYTVMRPLVMDFRTEARVLDITDQFMYGTAFLVNPVTTPGAHSRSVYLPVTPGGWIDFWKGGRVSGGRTVESAAPLDIIPLYVRAGSIVPVGPFLQYATEKPADSLEVRVYAGADGSFTLYEDENDGFGYEKGVRATISLSWNDRQKVLTVGERKGSFRGMLKKRVICVVRVREGHGTGIEPGTTPDATIVYTGTRVRIAMKY